MKAIIRISPELSKTAVKGVFRDKWEMVRICHDSFLAAGECDRVYLLDKCPDEWAEYFKKYGTVHQGNWDKKGSLFAAYSIATTHIGNVLLLEDDYLWRPNTLAFLNSAIDRFGFVSPYNHPDAYADAVNCIQTTVFNQTTWRRCLTNTHTFAVKGDIFRDHIDDFYYGMHDWQMYFKLGIDGVPCFAPSLSLATHLAEGKLAYDFDWLEYIKLYRKERI